MTPRWITPLLAALALSGCAEKKASPPAPTAAQRAPAGVQPPGPSRDRRVPIRPRPQLPDRPDGADQAPSDRADRPWAGRGDPRSREERQAARTERRAEMMDMYDADQDGALSDAERAAMRESRVVDMIGRLDANEDGRLTEDEFAQFGARGRGPALDFATVDADHDGAISAEEMSAALPTRGPGDRPPGARPGRRGSDDGAPPAPPTP